METTQSTVTLPKEVADALEQLRNEGTPDEYILTVTADPDDEWCQRDTVALNGIDIMTLASALVNGYTVEQTPHERLREYYDELSEWEDSVEQYGIKRTLEILGITVDGINT